MEFSRSKDMIVNKIIYSLEQSVLHARICARNSAPSEESSFQGKAIPEDTAFRGNSMLPHN